MSYSTKISNTGHGEDIGKNERQVMRKSFIRKNSDSPIGFEPMKSPYQLDRLTTDKHRTLGELGVGYYSNIHPAYTEKNMSYVMSLTRELSEAQWQE